MADIYKDIEVHVIALYSVGRISFSDATPPTITSLYAVGGLSFSVLISDPIITLPLQGVGRLSGSMYDFHIGSAIVAWSDIGNMDFSITRQNIAGNVYMRWQGQVWHGQKLGGNVIMYGDGGITAMIPSEQYFGFIDIQIPGILCKTAIAGSDNTHYFINTKHELCKITNLKIERIGFSWYLKELGDLVSLSYIEAYDTLFIASPSKTFKYQDGKLTESHSNIVQVIDIDEKLIGITDSNVDSAIPSFQTLPISYPGDVTISSIHVGGDCKSSVEVYRKLNKQSPWVLVKTVTTNSLGHASIVITGKDFKFTIKPIAWATDSVIDEMTIYFKHTDKRFGKGIDAKYLGGSN